MSDPGPCQLRRRRPRCRTRRRDLGYLHVNPLCVAALVVFAASTITTRQSSVTDHSGGATNSFIVVSGFSATRAGPGGMMGRGAAMQRDSTRSVGGTCTRLAFLPSAGFMQMDKDLQQRPVCSPALHSTLESQSEASQSSSSVEPSQSAAAEASDANGAASPAAPNMVNGISNSDNTQSSFPAVNGATDIPVSPSNLDGPSSGSNNDPYDDPNIPDVPQPTAKGGYSHTKASRAKISAANKGKVPWNKGKARSEEVRARIAAGVRAKNRERFLKKIADMGLTEEEYNAQKKEEKRKREADRRARRTEKGGYRPTEETKAKISAILKEKWAKGEVKKRAPSTGNRRKGFKHSEETKQKIRESLRKLWANDPEYRAKKEESARKVNSGAEARKKIGNTLKKKWEDPEFRAYMMERIKQRKKPKIVASSHREKISQAIKKKWQNESYRQKAIDGMKRKMAENPRPARKTKPKAKAKAKTPTITKPKQKALKNGIYAVMPATSASPTKKKKKKVARKTKTKRKSATAGAATAKRKRPKKKTTAVKAVKPITQPKRKLDEEEDVAPAETFEDGSIAKLRQERRDLYDLLYGCDDDAVGATEAALYDKKSAPKPTTITKKSVPKKKAQKGSGGIAKAVRASGAAATAAVAAAASGASVEADLREPVFSPSLPNFSFDDDDDDDNLDNFDPYGLEDY